MTTLLDRYLHDLPDFRGKWRLLRPFARWLDGRPVRSRFGVILSLDLRDRTNQLCVLGRYDATVPNAVGALRPGDCLVDVGANCGLFSLMAARAVGPDGLVIAFEPCRATFETLVRNCRLNGFDNIVPFNLAIADATGAARLDHKAAGHSGRNSMSLVDRPTDERIMTLAMVDAAAILKLVDGRRTLIKIDVEGFELAALAGLEPLLAATNVTRTVIEIDERYLAAYDTHAEDIYAMLSKHGFRAVGGDGTIHFDAVFERPAVVSPPARAAPASASSAWPPLPPQRHHWAGFARVAATILLLAAGWTAASTLGPERPGRSEARSLSFASEAIEAQEAAQVRRQLAVTGPPGIALGEACAELEIAPVYLPNGWRVTDFNLVGSDHGPGLRFTLRDPAGQTLSLFAVRDPDPSRSGLQLVRQDGVMLALWDANGSSYALAGSTASEQLTQAAVALSRH